MKKIIILLNKLLLKIRKKQAPAKKLKKVLVVSNTALGDTILSTPVIKTLRKSFPNIYIALMVNKNTYPLFKDYEYVDEIIPYCKSFTGIIRHALYIKKVKFDSIFLVHSNGPQDLFMALASNIANIHKAINYPNKISSEFSKLIKNDTHNNKLQHIIEHRLDTLRYLNPSTIDTTIDLPKKFYRKSKKNIDEILIGIQLGAADIYKIWPIENFIELSNRLLQINKKIKIILLGIKAEQMLSFKLKQYTRDKNRVVNYCGKTSIEELPCLVNSLDLLITNDTGTLHLAIALKKNSLSLFSPTDSKIFGPYQDFDLHTIIQKDGNFINTKPKKERSQKAMNLITVDEVYNEVIQQLDRAKQCVE